jgi:hypothetical protein
MPKKSTALKPGDVFVIPRVIGGRYFVIHLARNQFGDAFGLFEGHQEIPDDVSAWAPVPTGRHVYTGDSFIKSGRWRKIDHREDLLECFSANPELFHSKADNLNDPAIGPYGSAETSLGELRNLSESEATAFGVIQRTYPSSDDRGGV